MALVWKPAIYKSSTLTELPRPVHVLDILDQWDYQKSKVPKQDGETAAGHSRNARRIEVQGELGKHAGTPTISEADQLAAMALLDTAVDCSGEDRYEFFFYHDTGSTTYRKFKSCYTDSMKWSLGDENRSPMSYTLTIIATDPALYPTGPGA